MRSVNGKLKKEITILERHYNKMERRIKRWIAALEFYKDQIRIRRYELQQREKKQKEFQNEEK